MKTAPSCAIPRTPYVSKASTCSERKTPVTKEQIAMALGKGLKCVHVTDRDLFDILHKSVRKMVRKLAIKYHETSRQDIDDLDQNCWVRICAKLHTYKSSKSNFTTWCWRVCTSVLNRLYRRGEKEHEVMVDTNDPVDVNRASNDDSRKSAICMDVRKAVEDLRVEYPEHECIIKAMFEDADGAFSSKIVFCDIAKRSGISSARVSKFYKDIVQPFFIKRFEGAMV